MISIRLDELAFQYTKTLRDRKRLPRKHLIGSQGVELLLPKNFLQGFQRIGPWPILS